MGLLAPQRIRELLECAVLAGFKETDFQIEEKQSAIGRTIHVVKFQNSGFYLAFEHAYLRRPRGLLIERVEFSPGYHSLVERSSALTDWQSYVDAFLNWLKLLRSEVGAKGTASGGVDFTRPERIQLGYLVNDLLSREQPWPISFDENPDEPLDTLHDCLKRQMSKTSIGDGGSAKVIQSFIMFAPYDELLTLLQILPLVPFVLAKKDRPPFPWNDWDASFSELSKRMIAAINDFLNTTPSSARFNAEGEFHRELLGITSPAALLKLPGRDSLFRDVQSLIGDNQTFAIAFIDLDAFKNVNDSLGHAAGDRCLEAVAAIFGRIAVRRGKVYRYGGDEFVLLLPNATGSEAAATAERLRSEVEQAQLGGTPSVTTSIGVVGSDVLSAQTAQEIVAAADSAAYTSKKTGKNRVTVGPV